MNTHQARKQDTEAPDADAGTTTPLLQQQVAVADVGLLRRLWSVSWLTILGFVFLTFNSGMAIYRSRGERGAVVFVVFSYVDLLLLFVSLRWYEIAEAGSVARDRLKVGIWVLTTALTLVFTTKVAAVMPALMAVVVWVMAFATVGGGFYCFFLYDNKQ